MILLPLFSFSCLNLDIRLSLCDNIVLVQDKRTQSDQENSLQKDEFSDPGNMDGAAGLDPSRKDGFLDPKNLGLRRSFMKDFDGVSGLNINLACRGEYVVKPQVN